VNFSITSVLLLVFLIPSITFHEFMHGWAAYQLGDPTAKNAGRLTLNPIKSIDPFGSILLPLIGFLAGGFIFGYAKPVPYNPMYFKNLRKGEIIVGFAGPSANLALALVGAAIAWSAVPLLNVNASLAQALYVVGVALAEINLVLMFFNLIPIPPLDGSSIVPLFLPDSAMRGWYQMQRYSFVILIGLLVLVPMVLKVDPIGTYFRYTVMPLMNVLLPA
jgi:Zn-dependent protease